jgi:predicted metal-dependent hydrolase
VENILILPRLRRGTKVYKEAVKIARTLAHSRLAHFNQTYGFRINRVAIRNTRSRWGSASRKCNLNFTYRILYLPPHLIDYVIVHELAHLGAFNHSKEFWQLVARTQPFWKKLRQELRTYSL